MGMEMVQLKNLENMNLHDSWKQFPIILKESNPNYKQWYEDEKKILLDHLSDVPIYRINHIGSTSVPGLVAKPTVDILLELAQPYSLDVIARILRPSWNVMSKNDDEGTLDLNKGYTPAGFAEKVFHLHIKPAGDWEELYFRDYLSAHTEIAGQYGELKLSLEKKFKHNRGAYTVAKTVFVTTYTQKAREEFGGRYRPKAV